ncbi:MAG: sugar isomerase [Bacteroidia bacterium]|nr:sugar isomerase [Bacteroidia bacterium]
MQVTGTSALGAVAISGLSWSALATIQTGEKYDIRRNPLVVKPILTYEIPSRRDQTSWRSWGGIQSEKDAEQELSRIGDELKTLQFQADFPVEFLPVAWVRKTTDLSNIKDIQSADLYLVYAAGGAMDIFDSLNKMGKNIIFFCRHKSGPVYLWYEIISPRFLRQHTDKLAVTGIDENDVVIDNQNEILWRLRALSGLKNTLNSKIIAIGGAGAWAQPEDVVPNLVRDKFKLDIQTVSYEDLGKLIKEARADKSVISRAKNRVGEYLKDSKIKLETKLQFVENCFILEDVLTRIMEKFNCRALTINGCMGTIMPLAETSACLTLSLLNDAGYLAFCESDFVVVPSGILLANISGKPVFLNDPTYPHVGIITLAHCTAPRRMDGKKLEPARLLTHFESDYGAAPKVEMLIGQTVTNIIPDFAFKRNVGLLGKIVDNPFLDICRSQIDIRFSCDSKLVAEQMPGFHWMTVYGDYLKESGYALKKIGINFEILV